MSVVLKSGYILPERIEHQGEIYTLYWIESLTLLGRFRNLFITVNRQIAYIHNTQPHKKIWYNSRSFVGLLELKSKMV